MGGVAFGVDVEAQPEYVARFGREWFEQADALDRERLRAWVRRLNPLGFFASPPCEGESTSTFGGAQSAVVNLIPDTRDALREQGRLSVIENVRGARSSIMAHAVLMHGQTFGLSTDRPRFLEPCGFELTQSAALAVTGDALRRRSCLGERCRYRRLDRFGRRWTVGCCVGNLLTVVGKGPVAGTTLADNARAMGMDVGHMTFGRLRKALPPAFIAYAVGQMVMHHLRTRYGMPVVSYDEMLQEPSRHWAQLRHWQRGAGGTSPSMGLQLESTRRVRSGAAAGAGSEVDAGHAGRSARVAPRASDAEVSEVCESRAVALDADATRELDYTFAGDYDQQMREDGATDFLSEIRVTARVRTRKSTGSTTRLARWLGRNTLVVVGAARRAALAPWLASLGRLQASPESANTRVTVVCAVADELHWRGCFGGAFLATAMSWTRGADGEWVSHAGSCAGAEAVALSFGHREVAAKGVRLAHAAVEPSMDPRDLGIGGEPSARKLAISYTPMPKTELEAWRSLPFPERVVRYMTEGVTIAADDDAFLTWREGEEGEWQAAPEEGQYAFVDSEHFARGCAECDRAILVGHLEPVPADRVEWALTQSPAHPWTVVQQGEKWRACQDYSRWTNRRVGSKPFTLPSVFDVRQVVGPESHFAKFDLRDGFWSVPVAEGSRHRHRSHVSAAIGTVGGAGARTRQSSI